MNMKLIFVMCLMVGLGLCSQAFALSVDDIHVLKISGADQRAVIKTPDGKMEMIRVGDDIGSDQQSALSSQRKADSKTKKEQAAHKKDHKLIVTEISEGRIVLEEGVGVDKDKIIIRLDKGKQHVQRITKKAPPKANAYSMKTVQQPAGKKQ